ncbi:FkbM family methyltransferase [Herbaspirillum sp. LeCh32-8]|uniref:FkbM family methyltransferase n=1 Tax=Herbaspirillum sp. LeCh32-8 TaxID=2821356 RepID=UPI001AE8FDF3|nr:FkbM family methyltransferase [Herbaspirillum sp. LeCh32-8]MBP0600717.1 FkbM family methyltransferase [Herbaspirillum sp. LeCh32-8]
MFNSLPDSVSAFYSSILSTAIHALKFNNFTDNYDVDRLNSDERNVTRTLDFDLDTRVRNFDWFFQQREGLYRAYALLEDDESKRLFMSLITFRLTGFLGHRIPVPFATDKAGLEHYRSIEHHTESTLPLTGMLGKLRHYDFEFDGDRYRADCLGFEYYLFRRQYFYERDGVRVLPEKGDVVIDGGACLGDTALVFSNAVGATGKVYAFDPVAEHLKMLELNIAQFQHPNVVPMPYGLSDHNVDCPPMVMTNYQPAFRTDGQDVPLRSLDDLVAKGEIDKVDFIKLDIEGAELEMLQGAGEAIRRFRPKLAVSLYHKPNDLFELVEYIHREFPFYKLYLGHYTIWSSETVLYCAAH